MPIGLTHSAKTTSHAVSPATLHKRIHAHLDDTFSLPYTSRNDANDPRFGDIFVRPQTATKLVDPAMCKIALLGIPQHIGVERNGGRIGAADAPMAIRQFLMKLTPFFQSENDQYIAISDTACIYDFGNIRTETSGVPDSLEVLHERQYTVVKALLEQNYFVICLGGGHDIAAQNARAMCEGKTSSCVINCDPHLDVRPMIGTGSELLAHSGSPFRQMLENPEIHIPAGSFVEFGIQEFAVSKYHAEWAEARGARIYWYSQLRQKSNVVKQFRKALSKASKRNTLPTYVSFDMDSVASSYAPGVSATAVVGFSADEILHMARCAAHQTSVQLIDIAEVNPRFDADGRTAKLAAFMIANMIAGRCESLLATEFSAKS